MLIADLACYGPDYKESDLASAVLSVVIWRDAPIQGRKCQSTYYSPSDSRVTDAVQDEKPIQTIHLGSRTQVEHTYEESQAQGSWKIVSDGPGGQEVSPFLSSHALHRL